MSILGPTILLTASACLFALAGEVGGLDTWHLLESASARMRIELPGQPRYRVSKHRSWLGPIERHGYSASASDVHLSVSYSDLPRLAAWLVQPSGILGQARTGLLDDRHATELSYRLLSMQKFPGAILTFLEPDRQGGPERHGEARFLLVERRLYVVIASGWSDAVPGDQLARYFDSFEVWPPE